MRSVPLAPLELTNVPVFFRSPLYTCPFEPVGAPAPQLNLTIG